MWFRKNTKIIFKGFVALIAAFCVTLLGGIIYMNTVLPEEYSVISGNDLTLNSIVPIKAVYSGESLSESKIAKETTKDYSVNLKAFGIIPIKQATVKVVSKTDVLILGNPFGIKIYTDGVMVVDLDFVITENGKVSPGKKAGVKEGDLIISINGVKVFSNEDVASIIENSNGKELTFKIKSDGKTKKLKVRPELCYQSGKYKTGIWVRDSSAGIGTLTFYSPALNTICGLGHGICDADTGKLLTLNSGELVKAEILDISVGKSGSPGELIGRFKEQKISNLKINNETGVFGNCNISFDNNGLIQLALKQEIAVGDAEILTTTNGETPKLYKCKIEKIAHNNSITKNMVIKITDEELISKTGGIVQGMSGSPILQNGKLIGAVTHVLVDDPTKGYGIFAENMLETAQSVADNNLIEAS